MANTQEVIICEADFDVQAHYQSLVEAAPKAGAVVLFVGLVRDFTDATADASPLTSDVEHLELQHYPQMTETLCQEIIDQARSRFGFEAVRVVHRVGVLKAHQQIVLVAVASRHRDKAFQAAQFIMDYLKTRATFWKKEVGSHGGQWLGVKDSDQVAAQQWQCD